MQCNARQGLSQSTWYTLPGSYLSLLCTPAGAKAFRETLPQLTLVHASFIYLPMELSLSRASDGMTHERSLPVTTTYLVMHFPYTRDSYSFYQTCFIVRHLPIGSGWGFLSSRQKRLNVSQCRLSDQSTSSNTLYLAPWTPNSKMLLSDLTR